MIRTLIGSPVLVLRRLVADPIYWLDEQLGSGKPVREKIEMEVDMAHFSDDADKPWEEKDTLERAIVETVLNPEPEVMEEIRKQLKHFDHIEVIVAIRNTDPKFKMKTHLLG